MQKLDVAFVMYPVTNMKRAVAFYSDVLGLKKEGLESDFWVEFAVGATTFGIGNFEQVGAPGSAHALALEVPDLDAFRARLKSHGVDSTEPHVFPSCRICAVKDPDGNTVWLHQRA